MSQRTVYLYGYSGRRPAEVLDAALRLDTVVFDIRYSPRSRRPEWSKAHLSRLLVDRYQHVPAWGNVNYRSGGPIVLTDPEGGLAIWDAETRPTILLCQCRESAGCHRMTVATLLIAERDVTVQEIDDALQEQEIRQLTIFTEELE